MDNQFVKDEAITSWLETPSDQTVLPPVETTVQELPIEQLSWENFERLCLRLARTETDIESCRLYGEKGEKQGGIDFFSRVESSNKYKVYQCKRVRIFDQTKIKEAVTKFLEGDWAEKTEIFFLCTSDSFKSIRKSKEFLKQQENLEKKGIHLKVWDKDKLSIMLKKAPEIVDDFFGRKWVEIFCGREKAEALGDRLDSSSVLELRKRLSKLYSYVFNRNDPGLPGELGGVNSPLTIEKRYVVPDVYEKRDISTVTSKRRIELNTQIETQEKSLGRDPLESDPKTTGTRDSISYTNISYQQRIPIEEWLTRKPRSIVFGEPGSGKSSLLRFIAMDLLQKEPSLSTLASKWGQYLPVWVPFALWAKRISDISDYSLTDLLESFFNGYEENDLSKLVKQALKDERLLLLVDGLDEWTAESAAMSALGKLLYFIETRGNIPVIVTSRPRGFERLGFPTNDWQIGTLSDFSSKQQEQFSRNWFSYWIKEVIKDYNDLVTIDRQIEQQTEEFLTELYRSNRLIELAKIPLLLGLLISLKHHQARLPENRFKAYDPIIDCLISTHPRKRRDAARLTGPTNFSEGYVKDIFSYLAYQIQTQFPEGLIEQKRAEALIEDFLKDKKGFTSSEAHQYSKIILDSGEREFGILVEKSPGELGFYHRTIQEYLTANYLYTLRTDEQQKIVSSKASDPQWFDTILSLFSLTKRQDDLKMFIEGIRDMKSDPLERLGIQLLLSEVAFGDFACPPALSNELGQEAFKEIEFGYWMPHRERILKVALSGLRSFPMRSLVQEKLQSWFPSRSSWREGIFKAMAKWPKEPEVIECLFRGIHDEETINRRAAAKALAGLANGDTEIGNRLTDIAWNVPDDNIRTAAIESLLNGWHEHMRIHDILEEASKSTSTILQLIGTKGRVQKGIQTNDDLERLLRLGASDQRPDFYWEDDFAQVFVEGWPGSSRVKRICLQSVTRDGRRRRGKLDRDLAQRILLKGYPQDDEVAQFCADQFKYDNYPFSHITIDLIDEWDILAMNFKQHPLLITAIEEWLFKHEYYDERIYKAVMVSPSPKVKGILLTKLNTSSYSPREAEALFDGWGMQDEEVKKALSKLALGSTADTIRIASLLPGVIEDRYLCRERLLEILKSKNCFEHSGVIEGLKKLGIRQDDEDIINACLELLKTKKTPDRYRLIEYLIKTHPSDKRVRELATNEISKRQGNYAAVAWGYGNDKNFRKKIIEIATPLPTNLRDTIAEFLRKPDMEDKSAMPVLELYDYEQNEMVKTQAAISFYTRLKKSDKNIDSAIGRLVQDIGCYGHDYEARRHAAFCGLVSLSRLDAMKDIKEKEREPLPVSISIWEAFSINIPLVRHILENWDYINKVFGTSFWRRISKSEVPTKDLWSIFCMFASDYPQVSNQALLFLETNSDVRPTSEILHFLKTVKPGSPLLLKYCLKTFEREFPNRDSYSRETTIAAAEILGTQFRGNQEVLDRIDLGKRYFYEYDIITLCEGWSDSKILDDLFKHLNANRGEIRERMEPAFLHLACLKGDSKLVFDELTRIIAESSPYISSEKNIIARPLINRIKKDDELWRILLEHLNGTPSFSDKASIPRLMIKARGVSSELRDWCIEELKKQLDSSKPPEFGLDLVSGQNRPVVSSILDELDMQNYSSVPNTIKQTTDTSMITLH